MSAIEYAFEARHLLSLSTEQLYVYEHVRLCTIQFEDGVIINSSGKALVYSSFFWDMLRAYPQAKILSQHHVNHVLKGKPLSSDTHIKLLTILNKHVVMAYGLHTPISKEPLLEMIYDITNNIHNEVTKMAEADVTSVDILDFIEVVEYPIIKEANDNTEWTHESITKTYKTVLGTIDMDENLKHNPLVRAIKSKMVNANQVCQCVSVRGFPTEVNGAILKVPIMSNYTYGMNTLYNLMAESRSAAKALYFSEAPLQDAEYFARRLQLLSMVVERVAYVDCGSTKYLQWRVSPPSYDDRGNVVYDGDLKFMKGKYYLDEVTGRLLEIMGNEEHLWNKVIHMRTALYCTHPDPHAVCEVCFGALAKNVSRFQNLGHLCSATMTQQTSQSVLSTKHLDASSVSANIVLNETSMKYLSINRAKNAYLIRKELKDRQVKMIINREEATGLIDILSIDDVSDINPIRVSSIECIEISHMTRDGVMSMPIFVNQGNRRAMLTTEFLRYLKVHRWETDGKNNFVFDLIDWNFSIPVMSLPDMEYSYSDHSHQIAKVIESSMKNITDRSSPHSPVSTLQELFSLVNTKLNVNIAALEVIIYASMVPSKNNYDMARNHPNPVLGIADLVIKNRSMGPGLAYQDQAMQITDARSFFKLDRPSSPFDVFFAPADVVKEVKDYEAMMQ